MYAPARFLRRGFLFPLLLLLLYPFTIGAAAPVPREVATQPGAIKLAPDSFSQDILVRHNQARAKDGLKPLVRSAEADKVAVARANDMAAGKYLAHFNGAGVGAEQFLKQNGVKYRLLGENIGRTNLASDQVVKMIHDAWMASVHHEENIMDGRFGRVGIAVVSIDSMYYLAVVFLD